MKFDWLGRVLLGVLLALSLSSCGGGGGGGGPATPSGPSVSVAFDPAEVRITARKGETGTGKTRVRVVLDASYTGAVSIGTRGGEALISDLEVVQVSDDTAELTLLTRTDLAPGSYADAMEILFCQDEVCDKPFAGGPFRLRIAVSVTPIIEVPASIPLQRVGSAALPAVDVPVVLPEPGLALVVEVVEQTGPEGLITPTLRDGRLWVNVQEAPPGQYRLGLRIRSADNRYQSTTAITYDVLSDGATRPEFAVSEPSLTVNAVQGQSSRKRVKVNLPSWASQATLVSKNFFDATLGERVTIERISADEFELVFDTANIPTGTSGGGQLVFGSPMFPQIGAVVGVGLSVDAAFVVDAATLTMTSASPAGSLRAAAAVRMVDGSAATWTLDASGLPRGVSVARTQGVTGADPIEYSVDPAVYGPGTASFDLPISVSAPGVQPATALLLIDDRLPRLRRLASAPVEARAGFNVALVTGFFPEDVVSNGKLEVVGVPTQFASIRGGNLLEILIKDPTPGVPVTVRLRYPSLTTTVNIPITAIAPVDQAFTLTLGFQVRRPPVYSQRQHAYYFASEDLVHRLANEGGRWVHTTQALPGVLQVELTASHERLLALTTQAIENLDPVTMQPAAPFRRLDAGEVSPEVASSFDKHLVALVDDTVAWATRGTACAGTARLASLADPGRDPTDLILGCNATTSLAALTSNGIRSRLTLYQNDASKTPVQYDAAGGATSSWFMPLGGFRGLVAADWNSDMVIRGDGTFTFRGGPVPSHQPRDTAPAGHTPGGYGLAFESRTWTYAYKPAAVGGVVTATQPILVDAIPSTYPMPPTIRVAALPQPVGCLPGRPADEPCDHRAHVLPDHTGTHVLVLGPQAAVIVPTASAVARTATAARPTDALGGITLQGRRRTAR